jgi:hypothetical protein
MAKMLFKQIRKKNIDNADSRNIVTIPEVLPIVPEGGIAVGCPCFSRIYMTPITNVVVAPIVATPSNDFVQIEFEPASYIPNGE